jgi:hypothetical protein
LAWGALVVVATAVALQGGLISDAAYQIATERPGFLPFEKMVLKRIPATAEDSLQQGAGKLLVSAGLLIVLLPTLLITIVNASAWQGDIWGRKALGIIGMACAVLSFYLAVIAARVLRKVHFAYFGRTVKQP